MSIMNKAAIIMAVARISGRPGRTLKWAPALAMLEEAYPCHSYAATPLVQTHPQSLPIFGLGEVGVVKDTAKLVSAEQFKKYSDIRHPI